MSLHPIHPSIAAKGRTPFPSALACLEVTQEQRIAAEQEAIDTFTEMVNAGATFQAALCAVYITGLAHALAMAKPRPAR